MARPPLIRSADADSIGSIAERGACLPPEPREDTSALPLLALRVPEALAGGGWPPEFDCQSLPIGGRLVRTATGKLEKFKLREPYWSGRERRAS